LKDLKKSLGATKKRSIALILSPAGLILLAAARLIVVANYNTTTAVTIASSGGYLNTFLGSVIPLVPVFAPYLALTLLLFKRWILSIVVFVFAAFITPTPMSLPQIEGFADARWHSLLAEWPRFVPHITGSLRIDSTLLAAVFFALVIRPLWIYHRSIAEAMGGTAIIVIVFALLFAGSNEQLTLPTRLRLASAAEGQGEHQLLTLTAGYRPLLIGIVIVVLLFFWAHSIFPHILATVVAIAATLALFPYVYNIYPLPRQSSYYSEVLHELWLPAQKIVVHSGHVYYGYILSSDPGWDTVLLTNREIVYLHADNVEARSVCQPTTTPQPAPYPPLVPWLYTKPSPTPPCARIPSSPTTIPSVISQGQSLMAIALKAHTWPWHIIALTNAIERDRLSAALRAYESERNWNAPTPRGQRFWYNPPITRQGATKTTHPALMGS
jgi:hypothetical protein